MDNTFYFGKRPDVLAFVDKGLKLQTKLNNQYVISSMVDIAEARDWKHLQLKGTVEFRREAWLHAYSRGMDVHGYKPTQADNARLKQMIAQRTDNEMVGTPQREATTNPESTQPESTTADESQPSTNAETATPSDRPSEKNIHWKNVDPTTPDKPAEKTTATVKGRKEEISGLTEANKAEQRRLSELDNQSEEERQTAHFLPTFEEIQSRWRTEKTTPPVQDKINKSSQRTTRPKTYWGQKYGQEIEEAARANRARAEEREKRWYVDRTRTKVTDILNGKHSTIELLRKYPEMVNEMAVLKLAEKRAAGALPGDGARFIEKARKEIAQNVADHKKMPPVQEKSNQPSQKTTSAESPLPKSNKSESTQPSTSTEKNIHWKNVDPTTPDKPAEKTAKSAPQKEKPKPDKKTTAKVADILNVKYSAMELLRKYPDMVNEITVLKLAEKHSASALPEDRKRFIESVRKDIAHNVADGKKMPPIKIKAQRERSKEVEKENEEER